MLSILAKRPSVAHPPVSLGVAEFTDYSLWATDLWLAADRPLELRDYAIMGLGLTGELGELFEELYASAKAGEHTPDLNKEYGDVIYYAARIFTAFDIEVPAHGWESSMAQPELTSDAFMLMTGMAGLTITIAAGRVSEILKKYIRDSNPMEGIVKQHLQSNLSQVVQSWLDLVVLTGKTPQDLIALNREKVNGRHARGTLRGSGNNR